MKNKIKLIFRNLFLILSSFVLSLAIYVKMNFKTSSIEQLLYSLQNTEGTSFSGIKEGAIFTIIGTIIVYLVLNIPILLKRINKYKTKLFIDINKKKIKFYFVSYSKFI